MSHEYTSLLGQCMTGRAQGGKGGGTCKKSGTFPKKETREHAKTGIHIPFDSPPMIAGTIITSVTASDTFPRRHVVIY